MIKKRSPNKWIIIIAVLAGILILRKMDILPSWRNIFSPKPVSIDETPILIKEIKSLGQIITATLYDEVVVDSTIINHFPHLPITDDHLVIIARGKVLAGIDLESLTDSSIKTIKDTVWMQLPQTKLLDVIINPSDYETFEEKGNWSAEAATAVKLKAKTKIIEHAYSKNIIDTAGKKAKAVIEDFLHAAGYKFVVFY